MKKLAQKLLLTVFLGIVIITMLAPTFSAYAAEESGEADQSAITTLISLASAPITHSLPGSIAVLGKQLADLADVRSERAAKDSSHAGSAPRQATD